MTARMRWRLAVPLMALSGLFLFAAVFGAITWWSDSTVGEQILTIVICLFLALAVAASLAIGIRPSSGMPWVLFSAVVATNLVACGVTVLRNYLP